MSILSYAQNFEDVMLWRALGNISNGFYIDIGAQHPIIDSVSKAFYEKGWRGIHVEATSAYAKLIREDRPDEIVLEIVLSDRPGLLSFYEIPETGLSTGDASIAEHHRSQGHIVIEKQLPCSTLADVFSHVDNHDVHWLKIDVEGMEARVLKGWQDSPIRPWILVIESTYPNSQLKTHQEWEDTVLSLGYIFSYFDGLSRYYVFREKIELTQEFSDPPNVFDRFSLAISSNYNGPARAHIKTLEQVHLEEIASERKKSENNFNSLNDNFSQRERILKTVINQLERELSNTRLRHEKDAKHLSKVAQKEKRSLIKKIIKKYDRTNQDTHQQYARQLEGFVRRDQQLITQLLQLQENTQQRDIEHRSAVRKLERAMARLITRYDNEQQQISESIKESRQRELAWIDKEKHLNQHIFQITQQAINEKEHLLQSQIQNKKVVTDQLDNLHKILQQQASDQYSNKAEIELWKKEYLAQHEAQKLKLHQYESALIHQKYEHERLNEKIAAMQSKIDHQDSDISQQQDKNTVLTENCMQLGLRLRQLEEKINKEQETKWPRNKLSEIERTLKIIKSSFAFPFRLSLRGFLPLNFHRNYSHLSSISMSEPAPQPSQDHSIYSLSIAPINILSMPATTPNTSVTAATLDELLSFNDSQFIFSAYQTLLGRNPDPNGHTYYKNRLDSGYKKIDILKQIKESEEGKSRAIHVIGLENAINQYKREKIPVIGLIFKLFPPSGSNQEIKSKLQSIERQLQDINLEINHKFNRIENILITADEKNCKKIEIHEQFENNNDVLILEPKIRHRNPKISGHEESHPTKTPLENFCTHS